MQCVKPTIHCEKSRKKASSFPRLPGPETKRQKTGRYGQAQYYQPHTLSNQPPLDVQQEKPGPDCEIPPGEESSPESFPHVHVHFRRLLPLADASRSCDIMVQF